MANLENKVKKLYLLMNELDISEDTKEGKMILAILDLLKDITSALHTNESNEEDFFICPNCNEEISIDLNIFESEEFVICPKCREHLNIFTHEF